MEAIARISVKLGRYPSHARISAVYDTFLRYLRDICQQMFPWIDFSGCVDLAQSVTRKNCGRMKLVLQTISDVVREGLNREFDVFSSSIAEIEDKLSNSFQKGREEFIIFHSEQHLTGTELQRD